MSWAIGRSTGSFSASCCSCLSCIGDDGVSSFPSITCPDHPAATEMRLTYRLQKWSSPAAVWFPALR